MNVVAVQSRYVPTNIAQQFGLVPQKHSSENQWYKIVLMDHVTVATLGEFIEAIAGPPQVFLVENIR